MALRCAAAAALLLLCVCSVSAAAPEQVHLSLTHEISEQAVTFSVMGAETFVGAAASVEYGPSSGSYPNKVSAEGHTYSTGGTQWPGTIYNAVMTGLAPSTKYYYRCVSPDGTTSAEFAFTSAPASVTYPTVVAMYGDLGEECNTPGCGDPTIKALIAATGRGEFDLAVHVGDIAYTSGTQSIWDTFMNEMQPMAANLSYMTIPGNHEHWFNFTGYINRFYMPGEVEGTVNNLWNSFDYSGIHFVGYSTEHDFYPGSWQLRWLEADLKKAAANRHNVPWIVMTGHRPCYCSTDDYYDCKIFGPDKLRKYIEPLMHQYGVDLYVSGHLHNYERMYPVFNGNVTGHSYTNPGTTIHVVAGMAGDNEGLTNKWENPKPSWSAVRDAQLGYGRVTVQDATTLTWDFVLAETGAVFDTFTIKKTA